MKIFDFVSRLRLLPVAAALVAAGSLSPAARAANCNFNICTGAPELYKVTVKEIALCTDKECSTKFVLGNSTAEFDIVNETGSFGGGNLEAVSGAFTHFHLKISDRLGTRGRVAIDYSGNSVDCITDPNGASSFGGFKLGRLVNRGEGTPGDSYESIKGPDSEESFPLGEGVVQFLGNDVAITVPMSTAINIDGAQPLPNMSVLFYVDDRLGAWVGPRDGDYRSDWQNDVSKWECEIGSRAPKFTIKVGSQTSVVDLQELVQGDDND